MTCPRKLIRSKVNFSAYKQGEEKEHEEGRFREEQIIAVVRLAESGTAVKELCRRAGISTVTFYRWKTKYAGMEISEMSRMRLLEDENARLKKIVAQQVLDIDALKVVLSIKW